MMDTGITILGGVYAHQVLRLEKMPKAGEVVSGRDPRMTPGGSGPVLACAIARMGGQARLAGQVGSDETGQWLVNRLQQPGIDLSALLRHPSGATGLKLVLVGGYDQRHTIVAPGANSLYSSKQLEALRPAITQARYLLLSLEIPLESVELAAQWAKEAGAIVILNPSPPQPLSPRLLANLDYLIPSEEELAYLTDAPLEDFSRSMACLKANELRAHGVKKVLVKMPGKGVLLVGEQREHLWRASPAGSFDLAKTGEIFSAAFALSLARNQSELSAGRYALAAASSAISISGDPPFLPAGSALEHTMRRLHHRQIRELEANTKPLKR